MEPKDIFGDSKIAILGTGAIGGYLAALAWKKAIQTTCVGREESVAKLKERGLYLVTSFGDGFNAFPKFDNGLRFAPDFLFIATKATGFVSALDRIPPDLVSNTVIVPLLNGLDHVEILKNRFGRQAIAGVIGGIEVQQLEPGYVLHSSKIKPHIEVASDDASMRENVLRVAQFLSYVGIDTSVLNSENEVLWGKLVRLNAIALTTAASQNNLGYVRKDPFWRFYLEGAVYEASAVAMREGCEFRPQRVIETIDDLPDKTMSSLAKDVAAGRPNELEALAGAIIKRGRKYGIDCPMIKSLEEMIIVRMSATRNFKRQDVTPAV